MSKVNVDKKHVILSRVAIGAHHNTAKLNKSLNVPNLGVQDDNDISAAIKKEKKIVFHTHALYHTKGKFICIPNNIPETCKGKTNKKFGLSFEKVTGRESPGGVFSFC